MHTVDKEYQLRILDPVLLGTMSPGSTIRIASKKIHLVHARRTKLRSKIRTNMKEVENIQIGCNSLLTRKTIKFRFEAFKIEDIVKHEIWHQESNLPTFLQLPLFPSPDYQKYETEFIASPPMHYSFREPLVSLDSLRLVLGEKNFSPSLFRFPIKNPLQKLAVTEKLQARRFRVIVNVAMLQHSEFLNKLKLLEIFERDFGDVPLIQIGPDKTLQLVFECDKEVVLNEGVILIIASKDRIPSRAQLERLTTTTVPFLFIYSPEDFIEIIRKLAAFDNRCQLSEFETGHERYLVKTFNFSSYLSQSLLQIKPLKEILMQNKNSGVFNEKMDCTGTG